MSILQEIQKVAPSAVIELFILDPIKLGATEPLYFHSGTNGLSQNIVWQGQEYVRFPVEFSGFEISSQGTLPRPRMRVSNYMGIITTFLMKYGDLAGAKVVRKRTHAKYLDSVNFGVLNPNADPDSFYPDDIFYIDRKVIENNEQVEFELVSSLDLVGVSLPRRQIIQNLCPWKYRGGECGYTGEACFSSDDTPVSDPAKDVCGKRLSSCKARFGENSEIPFGGFPGAGLYR